MKLHLVLFNTFSNYGTDGYYDDSIERLKSSFLQNGGDEIHHYDEVSIPLTTKEREYFNAYKDQAFGFYGFKPIIILDVLSKIDDGDMVLYHDAGRPEYKYEFKSDLKLLANIVKQQYQGIGLSHGGWEHNKLTRDYCFKAMGCDTPYIRGKKQLAASWGVYEKNPKSLAFIGEWKKWCLNYDVIRTEEQDEQNHKEFEAHRWDQSILTNLFYMYSLKPLPNFESWEKDINTFIHDYSNIEVCTSYNTVDGTTLILDIVYKDNKLFVISTGAVKSLTLSDGTQPSTSYIDTHKNFNIFIFDREYEQYISLLLEGEDVNLDSSRMLFKVKYYTTDLTGKSIITVIFHNRLNSIENIKYFIDYHLNLGVDTVILHENSGERYKNMLPILQPYLESGRVVLKCLRDVKFYQTLRKDSPGPTNVGEVSHMNLTNTLYKEAKCIVPINVDEFLITDNKDFNTVIDELITDHNASLLSSINMYPEDYGPADNNGIFYESTNMIEPVNNFTKFIAFPSNCKVLTCHSITTTDYPSITLTNNEIYFIHYPFLDNNRGLPPSKGKLEEIKINKNLFKDAI